MEKKSKHYYAMALIAALWLGLSVWSWLRPSDAASSSERRPLAQFPPITAENLTNGSFMTKFEDFTLDQFPLRDTFRTLKALVHYNVLQQGDNNGIYVHEGYAAKLEYPLNEVSLSGALEKLGRIYETYLAGTDCSARSRKLAEK